MDEMDKQIIRFLQNDAKMTIKEIALKLNLSLSSAKYIKFVNYSCF